MPGARPPAPLRGRRPQPRERAPPRGGHSRSHRAGVRRQGRRRHSSTRRSRRASRPPPGPRPAGRAPGHRADRGARAPGRIRAPGHRCCPSFVWRRLPPRVPRRRRGSWWRRRPACGPQPGRRPDRVHRLHPRFGLLLLLPREPRGAGGTGSAARATLVARARAAAARPGRALHRRRVSGNARRGPRGQPAAARVDPRRRGGRLAGLRRVRRADAAGAKRDVARTAARDGRRPRRGCRGARHATGARLHDAEGGPAERVLRARPRVPRARVPLLAHHVAASSDGVRRDARHGLRRGPGRAGDGQRVGRLRPRPRRRPARVGRRAWPRRAGQRQIRATGRS